jgi:hypothetical protein
MLIAIKNRCHQELHTAPALTERFTIRRVYRFLSGRFPIGVPLLTLGENIVTCGSVCRTWLYS